jgi:hypothetical protein
VNRRRFREQLGTDQGTGGSVEKVKRNPGSVAEIKGNSGSVTEAKRKFR